VLPVIREIQVAGAKSNAAIAVKLNERRVPTARGGVWTHVQVHSVIGRSSVQFEMPSQTPDRKDIAG
jgi:hypothetical protein